MHTHIAQQNTASNNQAFNPYNSDRAIASESIAEYSKEYQKLKRTIKSLSAKATALKNKMIDFIDTKEELVNEMGMHLHYYNHETRQGFDEKTFKRDMPRLHAQYLKVKELRRFV